jgi:hypothetical protein
MRQAAVSQTNVEPFLFQLGIRANKLDIIRKDDSIEIKPKDWLNKKEWREINEILAEHGFEWLSHGRDSCWLLKKL